MITDEILKNIDMNQFFHVGANFIKKCSHGENFECAFWCTPTCDSHEYQKLTQ